MKQPFQRGVMQPRSVLCSGVGYSMRDSDVSDASWPKVREIWLLILAHRVKDQGKTVSSPTWSELEADWCH